MNDGIILETRHLGKRFGALVAVDDVSLQVRAGSFHSIIGPNGAGKTTLFNLVSGALQPSTGSVVFGGRDITSVPRHRRAHLGIGRSFQSANLFAELSVLENVRLAAQAMGRDNRRLFSSHRSFHRYLEQAGDVLARVGLDHRSATPARLLPHGEQRKLEMAMILASDPELLLLDEPTAGMASADVPELIALVKAIQRESGKTVLIVEHNMNVVMGASDTVTVMSWGAILAQGAPAEIAANETVQSAYLGTLYESAPSEPQVHR